MRNELHQRYAGAVEVDQRVLLSAVVAMQQPAGVLLEVDALDADRARAGVRLDLERAADAERLVVLRDLVTLRQVGVGVVLAIELGELRDLTAERQPGEDRVRDRLLVDHGQRAGQPERDRVDQRVRLAVEVVARAVGEHLRLGAELTVHLETDHDLVLVGGGGAGRHGWDPWDSCARVSAV